MNPNMHYKYSDLGTVDNRRPRNPEGDDSQEAVVFGEAASEAAQPREHAMASASGDDAVDATSIVYDLDQLSIKRPGAVLAVGYGNPLKAVVRAATTASVAPLFTTGTDDKLRAFSFGGSSNAVSLGKKFDARLFANEYAVLTAAEECAARAILCAANAEPTKLLAEECARRNILLLVPVEGDRTLMLWKKPWEVAGPDAAGEAADIEWRRCAACGFTNDNRAVVAAGYRCPTCGKLVRLTTDERMGLVFDAGSVEEWDAHLEETNALDFPDFEAIIERARSRSGYEEAARTGRAAVCGVPVAFGIMEPSFMMASMGHVVGEKLTRMFERATEMRLPVVVFCASGGARMQEGLTSLMQMAKVSAAVEAHSDAGLLYVSVLTDPTTGGVTASFATLGDVILAEPGANIGFAGRRVIQDTIKQALPDDFQTAEFALEHGLIDAIVDRDQMRDALALLLGLHGAGSPECSDADPGVASTPAQADAADGQADDAAAASEGTGDGARTESGGLGASLNNILSGISGLAGTVGQAVSDVVLEQADRAGMWWVTRNKGVADAPGMKPSQAASGDESNRAWDSVQLARNTKRPTAQFYIDAMFDDFVELHGDRMYADDGAIIGGVGRINGRVVTVIAEEKGADLKAKIARNFGCPMPEGYRKAMRLMRQAEKFGRPIVCLVDTQGAFCGQEAEERGMGTVIAESLALMASLRVPIVSVVIGEGGSGGALALAVANRVAMQENAVYSVLSPEGFASILWKDGSRAPEAASVMKMSADDALGMGVIEAVITEGQEAAHVNPDQAAAALWLYVTSALDELEGIEGDELKRQRYERFRAF